jgi:hypothetical protein
MRPPIVAMCGILVLAGCGTSEQPVAEEEYGQDEYATDYAVEFCRC